MQMRKALWMVAVLAGSHMTFGQTVSVGNSSSTTSGTTTTVTIPVTVTAPPVTIPAATSSTSTMALLDVTAGTGDGVSAIQTVGQSFMTIALPTVAVDTASGWNAQTNTYTVPVTGIYLVTSKMRLVDGSAAGLSYGLGASTSNSDGAYFMWNTTAGPRNGMENTRLVSLNKGDSLRMFSYVDVGTGARLNSAELIVEQVH